MQNVYILKLVKQKWYIGITSNINNRWTQHIKGRGSAWTQLYKPVDLYYVTNGGKSVEFWWTLKYMQQYGIENVRGGPWAKPCLGKQTQKNINGILMFLEDRCFKCGQKGHFMSNCKK